MNPLLQLFAEEKIRNQIAVHLRLFEIARLEEVSHLCGTLVKLAFSELVAKDFPISPDFRLGLHGAFDWKTIYRLFCEQRVTRGVAVWVEPSNVELQEGQVVIFKITLTNVSDEQLIVEIGNTSFGNYFENGAAFVLSNAHRDATVEQVEEHMRRAQRQVRFEDVVKGQEQQQNYPIFTRIQPGETIKYYAKAKLSRKALLDWEGRLFRNTKAVKPGRGHAEMDPAYGFLNQRGYDFYLLPAPSSVPTETLTHFVQVRFIIKRTQEPKVTYWENKELKNPGGTYLPTPTTAKNVVRGERLPASALWWGDARSNIIPMLVRYDMSEYQEEVYVDDYDDDYDVYVD